MASPFIICTVALPVDTSTASNNDASPDGEKKDDDKRTPLNALGRPLAPVLAPHVIVEEKSKNFMTVDSIRYEIRVILPPLALNSAATPIRNATN
jgi:hypothetical protein